MEIQGKIVIVTGASAGIGLATAQRFAEEGAKVVLAARSKDKLNQLAEELRAGGYEALVVPTDMTVRSQVERMIDETVKAYGGVDILVNNAGQALAGTVADVSEDYFRQIIDLNIFGPLYAMQAVIPVMRKSGGGLILNVSSMVSKMSIPGLSTYAATKSALNKLSETAKVELERDNIRVITVYPRMTATDFGKNSLGHRETRQRQRSVENVQIDTPEFVAEKILQAVIEEPDEQYMEA